MHEMSTPKMNKEVRIGIIGGSGFYQFLEERSKGEEIFVNTPYGLPSDKILLVEHRGRKIAFLPRHGKDHQYPPHKINYRANLFALKKLGVQRIIAPGAVGSLKPEIAPGTFVLCDQFIARTFRRHDTFFDGAGAPPAQNSPAANFGRVAHISMAEPYCPELRQIAFQECQKLGLLCREQGTVVVIEGPRFSTKAESNFYSKFADVINMTQYPEVTLARELEMCYLNISLVTDYDVGLKDNESIKPVSAQEVIKNFQQNTEKLKHLILEIIKNIPDGQTCSCYKSLQGAFV